MKRSRVVLGLAIIALIIVTVIVVRHPAAPPATTPAMVVQQEYNALGVTGATVTTMTYDLTAQVPNLNTFSHLHADLPGLGWHLRTTINDGQGNPVYSYNRTYQGRATTLVLSQVGPSLDQRQTRLVISCTPF